jgi:hypothetical protein
MVGVMVASGLGYLVAEQLVSSGRVAESDRMVWMTVTSVPLVLAGFSVALIIRARSMRSDRGVTIDVGPLFTVTTPSGRQLLSAPVHDIEVTQSALLSPRTNHASASTAPIVGIRNGRQFVTIGCTDGSICWRGQHPARFTFDWACDRVAFMAIAEHFGIGSDLTRIE